ncbi:MAG TPA: hypothetical protein VNO81_08775 [Candidatus Nitrosotenuis sp.]|nr:hypothetical protein [Candidatus Nitrosotenuis sp.]
MIGLPEPVPAGHPLRRLFTSLLDKAFLQNIGVYAPAVVSYLADLLADFTHIDAVYRIRSLQGRRLHEVAEMLLEAQIPFPNPYVDREREIYKHVGDYTLFWTGVYPESLALLRHPHKKDYMIDYVEQGKASYARVSSMDERQDRDTAPLFRQLSREFEVCAQALYAVRREWEHLAAEQGGGTGLIHH